MDGLWRVAVARVGGDDSSGVRAAKVLERIVAGIEEGLSCQGVVIGLLRRESVPRVLNAR